MSVIDKYIDFLKLNKKENETICFKINEDVDVICLDLNSINYNNIFFLNFNDVKFGIINDNGSFIMFRCKNETSFLDVTKDDKLISLYTCTRFFGKDLTLNFSVTGRLLRDGEKVELSDVKKTDKYDEIVQILEGGEEDE